MTSIQENLLELLDKLNFSVDETPTVIKLEITTFENQSKYFEDLCSIAAQNQELFNEFTIRYRDDILAEIPKEDWDFDNLVQVEDEENNIDATEFDNRLHQTEEYSEVISDLCSSISGNLKAQILVDKKEILQREWNSNEAGLTLERVNVTFWFELSSLKDYIEKEDFLDYSRKFFSKRRHPVFLYYNSRDDIDEKFCFRYDDTHSLSEESKVYKESVSNLKDNVIFDGKLPEISPCFFNQDDYTTNVLEKCFYYSVMSCFSDKISLRDPNIIFSTSSGPKNLETTFRIDFSNIGLEKDALFDLYSEFREKESKSTFVNFWKESVVQSCEDLTDLDKKSDEIIEYFNFIETETVEENFKELSDAVRDTRGFMTDITSKLSNNTLDVSKDIQRTVLTLLGALIANAFLILRWSEYQILLPFSSAALGIIALFYFPVIDERVNELSNLIRKSSEDFKTYENLLSRYTTSVFDFEQIKERKADYVGDAEDAVKSSRKKIKILYLVIITTGFLFSAAEILFYSQGIDKFSLVSSLFALMMVYETFRLIKTDMEKSYHKILSYPNILPIFYSGVILGLVIIQLT